ncbi:MAG: carbon-nitrogen hydrolase family protein [Thermoplasmata archaeon]|nr:carbon-nitrogen hydrolase family protein [Thermoplasmata archaeon]
MAKIALVQVQPRLGDKAHNIELVEKSICSTDAEVLAFSEMFLTGYTLRDRYQELAEGMDGPSVRKLDALAKKHGRWLIVGMPELDPDRSGIIYNSALVLSPDSEPETYRKMVLANFGPFEEDVYFARGDRMPIFETPVGRMGIEICFDIFFPEITKLYALEGADIVLCISASPSVTREYFEKLLPARAIENTIFIAYANLVGTEQNMTFWGGNQLIGPRGTHKAGGKPFIEGIVKAEVDLSELEVARQFRPTIRETRRDLMEKLGDYAETDNHQQH